MPTQLEITKSLERSDLKEMALSQGPCITIYVPQEPAPNMTQMEERRLRVAIRTADEQLRELGTDERLRRELIESLGTVEREQGAWGGSTGTLVILRSQDVFRAFEVRARLDEKVVVGQAFHIFPLIHSLNVATEVFYILALSQKRVRLLRCTPESSQECEFPADVPRSLETFLTTRMPNASPGDGNDGNNGPTGSFTSTSDVDNKDQHLANFYRAINKAVFEILRGHDEPLILCGVEYERVMYKQNNSYQHLMEEGVQGSPDAFRGGEMHARALDLVQEYFSRPAQKALGIWNDLAGGERALKSFPDIVKAAFEARIGSLLAAENASSMGVFDREHMRMGVTGRQEDLVNAAALMTYAYGGEVFILKPEHVPGGGQLAAIARF